MHLESHPKDLRQDRMRRAGRQAIRSLIIFAIMLLVWSARSATAAEQESSAQFSREQAQRLFESVAEQLQTGELEIDVQMANRPSASAPEAGPENGREPNAMIEVSGRVQIRLYLAPGASLPTGLSAGTVGVPASPRRAASNPGPRAAHQPTTQAPAHRPVQAAHVGAHAPTSGTTQMNSQSPSPASSSGTKSGGLSGLPVYRPKGQLRGRIISAGSDTMNNLMDLWGREFIEMYPEVRISHDGRGSGTAPPALIEGRSNLGPMSRPMKEKEEEAMRQAGFRALRFSTAVDCIAVYVNERNPIRGLSLEQLDGIFSRTHKTGTPDIVTWGGVGLQGNWRNQRILLFGRNELSGTHAYFKKKALKKGEFKHQVLAQPGSAAVVNAVAANRGAIGYSGMGYLVSGTRALPLSAKTGEPFAEPTFENAVKGAYPLGRELYLNVATKGNQPLQPVVEEFLRFVLSRQGQELVVQEGFGALPPNRVQEMMSQLD